MVANLALKYTHFVVHVACSLLILLAICPSIEALRRFTPNDAKIAKELQRKAASADRTSYGQPVAELTTKPTSVDHFGSVRIPTSVCFERHWQSVALTSHFHPFCRSSTHATTRTVCVTSSSGRRPSQTLLHLSTSFARRKSPSRKSFSFPIICSPIAVSSQKLAGSCYALMLVYVSHLCSSSACTAGKLVLGLASILLLPTQQGLCKFGLSTVTMLIQHHIRQQTNLLTSRLSKLWLIMWSWCCMYRTCST